MKTSNSKHKNIIITIHQTTDGVCALQYNGSHKDNIALLSNALINCTPFRHAMVEASLIAMKAEKEKVKAVLNGRSKT